MRKVYIASFTALIFISICIIANAQRKVGSPITNLKKSPRTVINSVVSGTTADCDTINFPPPDEWGGNTYVYSSGTGGYLNGTNQYLDMQKGNYFDLSGTSYTYLTGALYAFGQANSNVAANLSKKVYFRVYEDDGGAPGTLLATEERTLSEIKADVDANAYTEITFTNPVPLPASKKIYLSVDIRNFKWQGTTKDSVWIAGTLDDGTNGYNQSEPGLAWEQWGPATADTSWYAFSDVYAPFQGDPNGIFDITLWIFPAVSTSAEGCAVLPVKLLSFNAQRNNKDVTLTWQIADEYNMKGYEIERADNNGIFKKVATVTALNYAKNQSYTVTDKNAFGSASTVQYRLKQIDGDGSIKFSRVIAVKANAVISDISFANPFNGALKLQLNLANAQNISIQIFDMQGKAVASEKNRMYNASANTILLNGTSTLKPGMYILRINAGTEQVQYRIIKQ